LIATGGTELFIGIGSGTNSFDTIGSDNLYHPGYTFDPAQTYGVVPDEIWFCITPLSAAISSSNKIYVSANLFLESQ
jgi:hypothetical protein